MESDEGIMHRPERRRGWIVPSLFVLLLLGGPVLVACQTRPLVIQPHVRPLDFAPAAGAKLESLSMMSFVDESSGERAGFMKPEKRYRYPPVEVLNDALLVSLRESNAFERVQRNPRVLEGGYVLRGELLALETEESNFQFEFVPSTLKITATCVTRYRLEETATHRVLLEETISTSGDGSVTVSGGDVSTGMTVNLSSGHADVGQSVTTSTATYDSTNGYEASLSDALGRNVSLITERVVSALVEQAAGKRATPAGPSDMDAREPFPVGAPPMKREPGGALESEPE
jgi:hypothetical protein